MYRGPLRLLHPRRLLSPRPGGISTRETHLQRSQKSAPPQMDSAAVVFDFDHSFAEECADFWVLEQLGRPGVAALEHLRDRLKAEPLGWNLCMQEVGGVLFDALVPRAAIECAAGRIPVFPHHVAVIKLAHQLGFSCHIVSDANTVWITECLKGMPLAAASAKRDAQTVPRPLFCRSARTFGVLFEYKHEPSIV